MLNEMDYDKPLSLVDQCSLQDGTLSIHLAANILMIMNRLIILCIIESLNQLVI